MIAAERVAIYAAADTVARETGIKPCAAVDVVLKLAADIDERLKGLSWWDRWKLKVRYAVLVPALKALHTALCGSR